MDFWLLPIPTDYERQNPSFQSLKRCTLFSFGLITQILFFHELFSTFKTQLEHISWIEMSTDKK